MTNISYDKVIEENEHNEILKIDERNVKAMEFLNVLTDMILNYSRNF